MWDQFRQRADAFDGAFAWTTNRFNLAQSGEIQPADGVYASGEFFTTLGVPALLGRTFTSADDKRGGGPDGPSQSSATDYGSGALAGQPMSLARRSWLAEFLSPLLE